MKNNLIFYLTLISYLYFIVNAAIICDRVGDILEFITYSLFTRYTT